MLSDQSRVLVGRFGVTHLDCAGQESVQFRALGCQLRLVGHRPNQRMPEGIFVTPRELHLVDELVGNKTIEGRLDSQAVQIFLAEAHSDHCCTNCDGRS